MNYLICILIGYALGNINAAYIISKMNGFDIRTKGSKNAGASNATVVMGWKAGVTVAIIDILKAFLSVFIVNLIFPNFDLSGIIAGLSCVIGHIFPVHMKFKGGKGLASYIGMILAIDWKIFIAVGLLIVIITIITDYIAIATLATVTIYPVYLYFTRSNIFSIALLFIVALIIYYKHISNIKRIIAGKEVGLRKLKKT